MPGASHIRAILDSLRALGPRRLIILGGVGLAVFVATGVAALMLSRPSFELLYGGLDKQDVARIGSALRDAGVPFDVSADGANVMVAYGQSSRARMLLAEKGLPHNTGVGYELFDRMGSLGLTSFMQDVTRVRATEGELARTIQTLQGVRSSRVHLVMPDEGSFRRARQPPSASVVIRAEGRADPAMARAIRHLVASAVAGMTPEAVTVLTTDGETLASGAEADTGATNSMLQLERTVAQTLQDNIRRTLTPFLGARNAQISVVARLNTDRRQTNETIYNPEQRVERSVRVTRETQVAQNASSQQGPAGVERNIPADRARGGEGKQSNEENQKREELTNYEISSKQIATVSGGYSIDRLDVAILVNRSGLAGAAGQAVDRQVAEIAELAGAAAGLRKDRGDSIKVSAIEFAPDPADAEASVAARAADGLVRQTGTIVNALAAVAVVALLIFGARPMLRQMTTPPAAPALADASSAAPAALSVEPAAPALGAPELGAEPPVPALEHAGPTPRRALQRRLEQIVETSEADAAAVLKRWTRADAG